MDNAILFVVIFLSVALSWKAIVFLRQRSGNPVYRERRSGYGASAPFHAVSIHPEQQCCGAVQSIGQTRFLSEDAPGLPLPQCDYETCRCKYEHHEDRRTGARDRRFGVVPETETTEFWSLKNRRNAAGRRGGDFQLA